MSSHNRLKLSDRRDVERKTLHTLSLLNMKNLSPVIMGEGFVNPFELYTTQTHIEADKLGLVLQKTLFESYDVPIIVVIGKNAYKYIIDGHHRALVSLWMRKHVRAVLI
ncbi:MAG: nuclease, partial [Thermosphaera sp.]